MGVAAGEGNNQIGLNDRSHSDFKSAKVMTFAHMVRIV
jgi:hypothetical protein